MPHRAVRTWLLNVTLALAAVSAGFSAGLARASPPVYTQPISTYERVKSARLVLWVQAVSATPTVGPTMSPDDRVTLEVREVLRGQLGEKLGDKLGDRQLTTIGRLIAPDFTEAPDAGYYRPGGQYLLFLDAPPENGLITLAHGMQEPERALPVVDAATELPSLRQYARIAALNDAAAERAALLALQAEARAGQDAAHVPATLADDIAKHFQTPSVHKSYAELLALYRQAGADAEQQWFALWAMANAPKPEARGLFERLVRNGQWQDQATATTDFVRHTKDTALMSRLLAALPTLQDEWTRWLVLSMAADTAGDRDRPAMLRALRQARRSEVGVLAPWFAKHPSPAATALLKRALKAPHGHDSEVAFALASLGDADVLAWGERMAASQDGNAAVGYGVIARSPLPRADEVARRIIREGDEDALVMLVQGYDGATQPNVMARLGDLMAAARGSAKVRYWVGHTLKNRSY